MVEVNRPQSAEMSSALVVELPQFRHPLLQLIATTRDLPPEFQAVSATLGAIFDPTSPRHERLIDATELEDRVALLSLGTTVQRLIVREVLETLNDALPCAQLWEKCAVAELREERIDFGTTLRYVLPDMPLADNTRLLAHNASRILAPWVERLLTSPLEEFVHTIEDARASIRLLRIAAIVDSKHDWYDDTVHLSKNQVALLGLWRLLEDRMRALNSPPVRGAGRGRRNGNHSSDSRNGKKSGPEGASDDRGLSEHDLFSPSYGPESRQKLLSFLLGKVESNHLAASRDGGSAEAGGMVSDGTSGSVESDPSGGAAVAANAARAVTRHLVVTQDIPPVAGKEDKETIARFQALRTPLPLPRLPDNRTLRGALVKLHNEFPWADAAIHQIAGQLLARERSGSIELAWSPILLVGQPGCGKSRLARRMAEVFKLPFLPLPLAGAHDPKLLLGTARSWSGAQPSPLLQFMVTHRCARGVVLLDEVEKTRSWDSGAGSIPSILLNLLEPETAKRWYDGFLQAPCDLSKLLFIATANSLTGLSKPLLSRMEPVLVPEPQREHFAYIARAVIADIAVEWGVPEGAIDYIDVTGIAAAAKSVRQLRLMMLRALADQAMTPRELH